MVVEWHYRNLNSIILKFPDFPILDLSTENHHLHSFGSAPLQDSCRVLYGCMNPSRVRLSSLNYKQLLLGMCSFHKKTLFLDKKEPIFNLMPSDSEFYRMSDMLQCKSECACGIVIILFLAHTIGSLNSCAAVV